MLAGRIGGLRCGGPLFDWQRQRVEMLVISYHAPSHGRGMPEGQRVGRRRKRVKPTSGATRHLLPKEGGRNGMSNPSTTFPWKGDARRAGGWPKAKESEANLRRCATSFQRKEGEVVKNHLLPSDGRGMPEGQGVGRRRKRAKPTSGATRHLLPEEGGRSGKKHFLPSVEGGMPEGQGVGRRRKRAGLSGIVILYLMRCFIPMRRTMPIASSAPAH